LSPSSRGLMAGRDPVEPDMPPRTWRQQRASGPHGFAVRDPSSPRGFAGPGTLPTKFWRRRKQRLSSCALLFAHGRPPFEQASRARRSRVHRIPPRVRDDRDPPLWGMRWRELIAVICPTGPAEFFCERDWTTQITLKSQRKSKFTRSGFSAHRRADLPSVSAGRTSASAHPLSCRRRVVHTPPTNTRSGCNPGPQVFNLHIVLCERPRERKSTAASGGGGGERGEGNAENANVQDLPVPSIFCLFEGRVGEASSLVLRLCRVAYACQPDSGRRRPFRPCCRR